MMSMKNIVFTIGLLATKVAAYSTDVDIIMYETENIEATGANIVLGQAKSMAGITISVVGQGEVFEGFGSKYQAVIPALRKMDAESLVVLMDSRDVLLNNPLNTMEAVKEFRAGFDAITYQHPGAIVVSAEAQCCVGALTYAKPGDYFNVDGSRNERACSSGVSPCLWNGDDKAVPWENFMKDLAINRMSMGDDIYLNAGLIAGKAGDMLRVFEAADINVHEDDQAVLTDYMYRRPNEIVLDYGQTLFGSNQHAVNGCMFSGDAKGKRLSHTVTGTTPLFIHSAGSFVECHENLAAHLGVSSVGSESRRKLQSWKQTCTYGYKGRCGFIKRLFKRCVCA